MKWWKRKEAVEQPRSLPWSLQEAVDQARSDWQNAQHYFNRTEQEDHIDDGIYYLKLTEKRFMFLLQQARQEQA
ncbi:MAG: DUF2508 family protein [Clostridia bacterium]